MEYEDTRAIVKKIAEDLGLSVDKYEDMFDLSKRIYVALGGDSTKYFADTYEVVCAIDDIILSSASVTIEFYDSDEYIPNSTTHNWKYIKSETKVVGGTTLTLYRWYCPNYSEEEPYNTIWTKVSPTELIKMPIYDNDGSSNNFANVELYVSDNGEDDIYTDSENFESWGSVGTQFYGETEMNSKRLHISYNNKNEIEHPSFYLFMAEPNTPGWNSNIKNSENAYKYTGYKNYTLGGKEIRGYKWENNNDETLVTIVSPYILCSAGCYKDLNTGKYKGELFEIGLYAPQEDNSIIFDDYMSDSHYSFFADDEEGNGGVNKLLYIRNNLDNNQHYVLYYEGICDEYDNTLNGVGYHMSGTERWQYTHKEKIEVTDSEGTEYKEVYFWENYNHTDVPKIATYASPQELAQADLYENADESFGGDYPNANIIYWNESTSKWMDDGENLASYGFCSLYKTASNINKISKNMYIWDGNEQYHDSESEMLWYLYTTTKSIFNSNSMVCRGVVTRSYDANYNKIFYKWTSPDYSGDLHIFYTDLSPEELNILSNTEFIGYFPYEDEVEGKSVRKSTESFSQRGFIETSGTIKKHLTTYSRS